MTTNPQPLTRQVQTSTATSMNRYPNLYLTCKQFASAIHDLDKEYSILVIGCSTGEEPYTLVTQYFESPLTTVYATDVNSEALSMAEACKAHDRIAYFNAHSPDLDSRAPYDFVFANAVLCKWPETLDMPDISDFYPFREFEKAILQIDGMLRAGGCLCISGTNYRFTDLHISNNYIAVKHSRVTNSGEVRKFDPAGKPLVSQDYPYSLFIKVA